MSALRTSSTSILPASIFCWVSDGADVVAITLRTRLAVMSSRLTRATPCRYDHGQIPFPWRRSRRSRMRRSDTHEAADHEARAIGYLCNRFFECRRFHRTILATP